MQDVPDSCSPKQLSCKGIKWRLFFGLSRTPHGILDVATPAMAALLCLGHFPPLPVIVVGLITAFAGYTAVYALNDLVDYHIDRERLAECTQARPSFDIDALTVPHPVAQGLLSFRSGLLWCLGWAVVALAGAWWLNPFCVVLFVFSACMEALYCKLLKVTHLKIIPSMIVKATGGLAGTYAVTPHPSFAFLAILFLWLAAWEAGSQNIPNDLVDREADLRIGARTTPIVKGEAEAVFWLLLTTGMAFLGGIVVFWVGGEGIGPAYPILAAIIAWRQLILPAREVYRNPTPAAATHMFNQGSLVPLLSLIAVAISIGVS